MLWREEWRWWAGCRGDPGMVWLGESGRSEGDTRPLVARLHAQTQKISTSRNTGKRKKKETFERTEKAVSNEGVFYRK